jgi:acyl carrier protein
MDIRDELRQFISHSLLDAGDGAQIGDDEHLIESGRIDSLGLIKLLGFIQQRYNIDLFSVAAPEDFVSVSSLAEALSRHLPNS